MSDCSGYQPHSFKRNTCRICYRSETDHPSIPDDPHQWSVSDVSLWLAHSNLQSTDFHEKLQKFQIDGSRLLDNTYINKNFRKFVSEENDWSQFIECRSRLLGGTSLSNSAAANNPCSGGTVSRNTASSAQWSNNPRSMSTIEGNSSSNAQQSVTRDTRSRAQDSTIATQQGGTVLRNTVMFPQLSTNPRPMSTVEGNSSSNAQQSVTRDTGPQAQVPATTNRTGNRMVYNVTNYQSPITDANEMISTDLRSRITFDTQERRRELPDVMANSTTLVLETSIPTTATPQFSNQNISSLGAMATASGSAECTMKRMRRVLFIGPTGSGKSTLINILTNNNVTETAMAGPAAANDIASGVTAAFVTYYDFPNNAFTDSIGLGDHRFNYKQVLKSLKSVLQNSSVGYNKIYICIRYGRIPADIRKYIKLIELLFGDGVLQWSSIIFTHCNDQEITREKYLSKNAGDSEIIKIIRTVNSVVFGDNTVDQDVQLETAFKIRRQGFLNRIKQNLDETAKEEYFKLPKADIGQRMHQVMRIFFGRTDKFSTIVNDIITFNKAFADAMSSSNYANYFGQCSICCEDVADKNKPVITKCLHLYHEKCLMQWVNGEDRKDCPVCRGKFGDSTQKFFKPLTINE